MSSGPGYETEMELQLYRGYPRRRRAVLGTSSRPSSASICATRSMKVRGDAGRSTSTWACRMPGCGTSTVSALRQDVRSRRDVQGRQHRGAREVRSRAARTASSTRPRPHHGLDRSRTSRRGDKHRGGFVVPSPPHLQAASPDLSTSPCGPCRPPQATPCRAAQRPAFPARLRVQGVTRKGIAWDSTIGPSAACTGSRWRRASSSRPGDRRHELGGARVR